MWILLQIDAGVFCEFASFGSFYRAYSCANGLKFKTVAVTVYGTLLSLTWWESVSLEWSNTFSKIFYFYPKLLKIAFGIIVSSSDNYGCEWVKFQPICTWNKLCRSSQRRQIHRRLLHQYFLPTATLSYINIQTQLSFRPKLGQLVFNYCIWNQLSKINMYNF